MYRLGSDLAHVHYHVSDIKENEVVEIPESEIVGMDIARFRMNLSKVSKDIGMVFVFSGFHSTSTSDTTITINVTT